MGGHEAHTGGQGFRAVRMHELRLPCRHQDAAELLHRDAHTAPRLQHPQHQQALAPASDGNNPEGYACKVGEWTGIDVDRILPEPRSIEGKWPFIRIMAAMTRVECGVPKDKLPWKDIEKGWELAYGEKE